MFMFGHSVSSSNKIKHIYNGNIKKPLVIKIMHWNKGSSNIVSSIDTLKELASVHKPHILSINEYNFRKEDHLQIVQIPGYVLEMDKLISKIGYSRTAIYISNDILYKRKYDLEPENQANVTLEIGFPNTKKIIIVF